MPNFGLRYEDHTYFVRDYLDNKVIDKLNLVMLMKHIKFQFQL
ncbi:MAG: hypothetical protein ABIL13_04365 [candidate division WOR-3 bacterium]